MVSAQCLKVAFIGTHGVGKTTLCFELAARLKRLDYHVDMVKEVARRCPLPLNRDTTQDAQAWILHTQIALEIEGSALHDILICDRSALDNYAYLVERFGRQAPYDTLVESWMRTYGLLVWVPPIDEPRFDGVRDTDLGYQRRIHSTIDDLITAFQVDPLRLPGESREAWLDLVLAALPARPQQLRLFGEEQG